MVRHDLGDLLRADAARLLDPARDGGVLGGAVGARELGVGDVADEGVTKGELALAGYGGLTLAPHHVAPGKIVKPTLRRLAITVIQGRDGTGPEHLADHGGVGQQLLRSGGSSSRRAASSDCRDSGSASATRSLRARPVLPSAAPAESSGARAAPRTGDCLRNAGRSPPEPVQLGEAAAHPGDQLVCLG